MLPCNGSSPSMIDDPQIEPTQSTAINVDFASLEKQGGPMYKVLLDGPAAPGDRNTIGGAPILPHDCPHPICRECGEKMALFFQLDLLATDGFPVSTPSHLLVFMCLNHDDIPLYCQDGVREPNFWETDLGTFCLMLHDGGAATVIGPEDPFLQPLKLRLEAAEEEVRLINGVESGAEMFKVGGVPLRLESRVNATCGCGANMTYLCQLPEFFEFPKRPAAPAQANPIADDHYILFLGNIVSFLACDHHCHPEAVTAICDG